MPDSTPDEPVHRGLDAAYFAANVDASTEKAMFHAAFHDVFGPDPDLSDVTMGGMLDAMNRIAPQVVAQAAAEDPRIAALAAAEGLTVADVKEAPTPPSVRSYYPVVFHADGTVTVLNKRHTSEWGTKALNQANRACTLPDDSYSTVFGDTYEEAVAEAERRAAEGF